MSKPANAPRTPDEAVVRVRQVIRQALSQTVDLNVASGFEVGTSVRIVTAAAIGAVLDLFCTEAVARGMPLNLAQDLLMSSIADTIADQRTRSNPANIN